MEDTSLAAWDWDSLLDFTLDGNDPQILPWDSPPPPPPPPSAAEPEKPPSPSSPAMAVAGRVRKRDPRLVCENFLAGRVPCACPEEDEMLLAEEAAKAEAGGGIRKKPKAATGLADIRCQVEGCGADIRELKGYHRRHRVCLRCANAPSVPIDGADRRYCQQCGKFHLLTDFDEGKRSCRRKLERHNRRRRRKPTDCINVVENEKEPQTEFSTDFTCDGELRSENEFACETLETILNNKVTDREILLDSDNGHGSPICSRPSSQNEKSNNIVSLAVSGEAHMDEAKDNPKSAISSTICDDRNTYSSLCPTGRISFKLYDWNPAEFPRRLRHQIFHWLASMPVELEGYIRPGCTILTIFIAMPQFMWEKLYEDASLYIRDLVNAPESLFLGRGNIFIYLSNMIVHLLEDGSSLMNIKMEVKAPKIHYVHPTYFEAGKPMEFVACGSNLDQPKFRLLISISGKYLVYDTCHAIFHGKLMPYGEGQSDSFHDSDHEMFRICINQTDPELFGPAFIEVENESGISNFIPLLFGSKHICSELERMQGAPTGSLCIDSLLSQVAVSGANPAICEILVSKQAALSELITDIAWFLKERDTDKSKAVMSSTNIQRLTCLLKFLIQNEFVNVLEVILQYFDAVIRVGIHKLENVIPHADQKLLLEYINCGKEVIKQRGLLDMKSEQDSGSSIQRILGPQSYDISKKNKDEAIRNIDETCSTSPSPFQDVNEKIPLLSKPMIDRKNRSQHLHAKWHRESWFDMYSPTFSRTRLSVFVMVGVVMCFVACVVFAHPLDNGGLVVSIRRCLFGDPLP